MVLLAELVAAAGVLAVRTAPDPHPTAHQTTAHRWWTPLRVGDHRTVELVGFGAARTEWLLARVAAHIGPAVAAVEEFWGNDWPHRITVVATATPAEFAATANAAVAADTAAVTVADSVDPQRRLAAGQQIVLAPGATEMTDAALRIVLGHELFHYATRAETALDAPRWLTEGVADFVARPPAPIPTESVVRLPSDAELDGSDRTLAYDRAWWFARFIADDYGTARLRELYRAGCGVGHADPATAVRQTLGTDLPDLLARWQHWATR